MCINPAHCRTSCRLELENMKPIFLGARLGIDEPVPAPGNRKRREGRAGL